MEIYHTQDTKHFSDHFAFSIAGQDLVVYSPTCTKRGFITGVTYDDDGRILHVTVFVNDKVLTPGQIANTEEQFGWSYYDGVNVKEKSR